jgi:topoisomerase-4 subunit B
LARFDDSTIILTMADLFQRTNSTTSATDYSAKDIEVLEGLEPVRRRPGMYIGGTDERALHHLVTEVLDNSMDEAVAGHATRIELTLEADGTVEARDNGRGIPIDPHPKFPKQSALEIIFTMLHSGGKFGGQAYKTSGGLHGVGVSVVNALSDLLTVEVARDRKLYRQEYKRGAPTGKLLEVGPATNRRGTSIRFHPDPEIFGSDAHFRAATVYRLARSKAYPPRRRAGRGSAAFPRRHRRFPRGRARRARHGDAASLCRRRQFPRQGRSCRMGDRLAGG